MKKSLLLGVVAVGMMFTSCGMGGASLKTDKDSVSYAIGTSIGGMAFGFDSTMNVDAVIAGVRDVFAKKSTMTPEQANAQIQMYIQSQQVVKQQEAQAKNTADSIKNAEVSAKYIADKTASMEKTPAGVFYKIDNAGTGKIQLGDTAKINYKLTLPDGTVKDSSYDRGEPTEFIIVEGGLIKGFVDGALLFGKGGKGTIIIPDSLGYGKGPSPIGPCQALTFEIEVVDVMPQKAAKK